MVLRNHFLWPICHLHNKNKEVLALRNNFRATKKFLVTYCTRFLSCDFRRLTLKDMGRGWFNPLVRRTPVISYRIILWSQNFLTLSINIPNYKVLKSFFYYLNRFSRIQPRPRRDYNFLGSKITKSLFFLNFFIKKFSNIILNLIEGCSQLSFEVYNVCVAQKLQFSEFLSNFFSPGPWP